MEYIIPGIFILIGLGMTVSGIYKKISETATTTARIVEYYEEDHSTEHGYTRTFYPVVNYWVNGTEYTERSNTGTSSPRFSVYERINISYNPKNPRQFSIAGFTNTILFGLLVTAVGVFTLLLVCGVIP